MKATFHLPGLFEFYEFYRVFLPLFYSRREYFYDFCEIGSIYGAPAGCPWDGGRAGFGENRAEDAAELMRQYGISARLTFSNSLLREEHLSDGACNALCALFEKSGTVPNGVILTSDLLLAYLQEHYPGFYFVSSTTKVLRDFKQLEKELSRGEFRFVVPDFRLNKAFDRLDTLPEDQNSCATSAAGMTARTGRPVMRTSAAKTWARTVRTTSASRRRPAEATAFPMR